MKSEMVCIYTATMQAVSKVESMQPRRGSMHSREGVCSSRASPGVCRAAARVFHPTSLFFCPLSLTKLHSLHELH